MRGPSVLPDTLNTVEVQGSCLLHSIWCLTNSDKQWVQQALVSALFMCTCIPTCSFADIMHICSAWFTHYGHLLRPCLLDLYTQAYLFTPEGLWTRVRRQVHFPLVWIDSPSVFLSLFTPPCYSFRNWKAPFLCAHAPQTAKQTKPKPKTCSHISVETTSILRLIIFCLQLCDCLNLVLSFYNWKD